MSMNPSHNSNLQSEINVTPMVDIMLVLLIIFMVITPLLQSGIPVNIPRAKNPGKDPNIPKENSIVVSIPFDGVYYVGRDPIQGKDDLLARIERDVKALKPADQRIIYIKGGVNVAYGEIVSVIDSIRAANIDQIGLVADKKRSGEQ